MRKEIYTGKGSWYRANLHGHSTISDGVCSPEEIKKSYQAMGYSIVAFTDHEVLFPHEELCDETFVALHGYETGVRESKVGLNGNLEVNDRSKAFHFNLLATRQDMRTQVYFCRDNFRAGNCANYIPFVRYIGEEKTPEYGTAYCNALIEEANKAGFLVTYNHPNWSLHDALDYLPLEGLHGVEVYNGRTANHGDRDSKVLSDFYRRGKFPLPIGTDDNHKKANEGKAFTMIKAETLTYDAVMRAYKDGQVYASQAPLFEEIYLEDGYLTVHSSLVKSVTLLSEGRKTIEVSDDDGIKEACFPFDANKAEFGVYFRLELCDLFGNRASTKAFFVKFFEDTCDKQ